MKTVGIISIVLFVISISTFASAYLLVKPSMTDDKTQEKCESVNENLKVGDECHIFKDGTCLKGKVKSDGSCDHAGNPTALILMTSSGILFIAGDCIFNFKFYRKEKKIIC